MYIEILNFYFIVMENNNINLKSIINELTIDYQRILYF